MAKEFTLNEKIYRKILKCYKLQLQLSKLGGEIESYLVRKGVKMGTLRNDDSPFVDMVDYGLVLLSKKELEVCFKKYLEETDLKG